MAKPRVRLLLVLLLAVSFVQLAAASLSIPGSSSVVLRSANGQRLLEDEAEEDNDEEENNNDEQENNNDSNDAQDNNDDADGSESNFFINFYERMKDDAISMWGNSPSTWVAEYWEVFGAIAGILFLILGCHCFIAYDLCCLGGGNPTGRKTVTQAELEMNQMQAQKRQDLNQGTYSPPMNQPRSTRTLDSTGGDPVRNAWQSISPKSDAARSPTKQPLNPDSTAAAAAAGAAAAGVSPSKKRGKKGDKTLMNEVVDVWSDFLGCSGENPDNSYHRYTEQRKKKRQAKQDLRPSSNNEIV